jgi:hypothetical protein
VAWHGRGDGYHLHELITSRNMRCFVQDGLGTYVRGLTRPDGVELYLRDWVVHAGTQAKGLVVLVHGGTWHSGYYGPLAGHLTSLGEFPSSLCKFSRARLSTLHCAGPLLAQLTRCGLVQFVAGTYMKVVWSCT